MKYVDLHTHSTSSDGTFTPSELAAYAARKGLAAFALTDHDTTDGLAEAEATEDVEWWDGCDALTEISIPNGSREKFEANEFWAEKLRVIKERESESSAVSPVLSALLPQTAVRRKEGAGI